jgi:RimJ/RimL family protein N-acetyltransferase
MKDGKTGEREDGRPGALLTSSRPPVLPYLIRLAAEPLAERHFDDLLRMHADPRQMEMLGGVKDAGETRAYLDRNLAHWADHGFGLWMLRDPGSGEMVGRALVRTLPLDGITEVEIGYSLRPDCWGRGLGTGIARACLRYGFDVLRLPSLVALTQPRNVRSRRVLEKVGMAYERDMVHGGLAHVLYRGKRDDGMTG